MSTSVESVRPRQVRAINLEWEKSVLNENVFFRKIEADEFCVWVKEAINQLAD